MSWPEDLAFCQGCEKTWTIDYASMPDYQYKHKGQSYPVDTCYSWCFVCQDITISEHFKFDHHALKRSKRHLRRLRLASHNLTAEILVPAHLRQRKTPKMRSFNDAIRERFTSWEGSLGFAIGKVQRRIDVLKSHINFLSLRQSKPRCLACGNHWFKPVYFTSKCDKEVFMSFVHPGCDSTVVKSRWTLGGIYSRQIIYLNIEGKVVDRIPLRRTKHYLGHDIGRKQ